MHTHIDKALQLYSNLPLSIRFPSYHPYYVVADANRKSDIAPVFFVYTENEETYYHAFHVTPIVGTNYMDIQSPYGYGGPLSTTADKEFLMRAWQEYCLWCKDKNILVEFMRFHPVIANEKYYGGKCCYDRKTIWIDLATEDLLSSYSVRVRTAIRKAIKNEMSVEWCSPEEFLDVFPELYRATMKSLAADDYYLFGDEYFSDAVKLPNIQLAICKYNRAIVAGAIFLVAGAGMEYHLSAANLVGKKMSATNLILHEAALLGKKLGCKVLHLGGGTDESDDNPLLFFKAGFSRAESSFHIGYYIHQPDLYQQMREQWKQSGKMNSKILFYR